MTCIIHARLASACSIRENVKEFYIYFFFSTMEMDRWPSGFFFLFFSIVRVSTHFHRNGQIRYPSRLAGASRLASRQGIQVLLFVVTCCVEGGCKCSAAGWRVSCWKKKRRIANGTTGCCCTHARNQQHLEEPGVKREITGRGLGSILVVGLVFFFSFFLLKKTKGKAASSTLAPASHHFLLWRPPCVFLCVQSLCFSLLYFFSFFFFCQPIARQFLQHKKPRAPQQLFQGKKKMEINILLPSSKVGTLRREKQPVIGFDLFLNAGQVSTSSSSKPLARFPFYLASNSLRRERGK